MAAGRIVLAGVLAGVGMYVWTSIAHLLLPISGAGIQEIPNDENRFTHATARNAGGCVGPLFFPFRGAKAGRERPPSGMLP